MSAYRPVHTDPPLFEQECKLGSEIISTKNDVKFRIVKACAALNKNRWKSNLPGNLKWTFFRVTVETILMYDANSWTLPKA